jgi:hypothetical protein
MSALPSLLPLLPEGRPCLECFPSPLPSSRSSHRSVTLHPASPAPSLLSYSLCTRHAHYCPSVKHFFSPSSCSSAFPFSTKERSTPPPQILSFFHCPCFSMSPTLILSLQVPQPSAAPIQMFPPCQDGFLASGLESPGRGSTSLSLFQSLLLTLPYPQPESFEAQTLLSPSLFLLYSLSLGLMHSKA